MVDEQPRAEQINQPTGVGAVHRQGSADELRVAEGQMQYPVCATCVKMREEKLFQQWQQACQTPPPSPIATRLRTSCSEIRLCTGSTTL